MFNGSVFKIAAELNGVPYKESASLASNPQTNQTTEKPIPGVPSEAAAKKVLPVFIIAQLALSCIIVLGAFWLVGGDDLSKYQRLDDRYINLIPANTKGHQKQYSIASVASDAPSQIELERGTGFGGHRPTESITDLSSHAALMGTSSPQRPSLESVHSFDDRGYDPSLRVLERPPPPGGYLQQRRDTFLE